MNPSEWSWILTDDNKSVGLSQANGSTYVPSGIDVFRAEYGGLTQIDGRSVTRPSSQLTEMRFHPGIADLELQIVSAQPGEVNLNIRGPQNAAIREWPRSDQIAIGHDWYAIEAGRIESWRRELETRDISLGASLDAPRLLWLLWESNLHVVSDVPVESLSGLRSTDPAGFDPALVRANLYAYQQSGGRFLSRMYDAQLGVLLADEMGLGKTMQAIYLLAYAVFKSSGPSLVVVPSSTLANWERELQRFAPSLTVHVHAGARRTGNPRKFEQFSVVLTSYDVVNRDRYLLDQVHWNVLVIDEAQAIKNATAQRSQAVKSLPRLVAVAITGTPIENSLRDLWSILGLVAPQYLGSLEDFEYDYPDEVSAAIELSTRVAPMTIRRTVDAVARDLPPRIDIPTPIFTSSRLSNLYEAVRLDDDYAPLVKVLRLRQLTASPQILVPEWGPLSRDFPKFDRLQEILAEVVREGGKLLVFASFVTTLDSIRGAFVSAYPQLFVEVVDGRHPPSERQKIIDRFTDVTGSAVLLLNPKAAGVGINIQAANYVVHFTPEWNPAVVAQASARAHRRGQERPVFVYYLYYVDTVEELMMERLDQKRALQSAGLSKVSDDPSESEVFRALKLSPLERQVDG